MGGRRGEGGKRTEKIIVKPRAKEGGGAWL